MTHLTARQQEVLALVARGKRYPEIAELLGISVHTVDKHVHAIKGRIGSDLPAREALTVYYWNPEELEAA